ncbi:SelB C-terminal domain-containing protein [Flavonifractor plautii]|nr:SelB C-terminal domain-containing protein [Flavonifractor plautii]
MQLYPGGQIARVRGLQCHGVPAEALPRGAGGGEPGGVRLRDVGRGTPWLRPAPSPSPTRPTYPCGCSPTPPFPCTPEVSSTSTTAPAPWCAAASSWDRTCSAPARGWAQLRFTQPVAAAPGDRFVARFFSPWPRWEAACWWIWRPRQGPHAAGAAGPAGRPGGGAAPPGGGIPAAPAAPAAPAPSAEAEGSWRPSIWGTAWSRPLGAGGAPLCRADQGGAAGLPPPEGAGRPAGALPGHLLHAGAVRAAEARLRGRFGSASFSLAQARDALGCSRRCALLLLEHWDASGVTRQQGEGRIFSTSA